MARFKTFVNGGKLFPGDLNSIQDDIDTKDVALADAAGANRDGVVRSGASIIDTEETTTSAGLTLLSTPDRVQNVVLPADGLLMIAFSALWKVDTTGNSAGAGIFLGANQLKNGNQDGATFADFGNYASGVPARWRRLVSTVNRGLWSNAEDLSAADAGDDVTTGQILNVSGLNAVPDTVFDGGAITVFAAAGTYDVSVKWQVAGGVTLRAKHRKMWVWTRAFA